MSAQEFTRNSALDSALFYLNLTTEDLKIRTDHTVPDSFRLPVVDYFFRNPLAIPDSLDNLAQQLESAPTAAKFTETITRLFSDDSLKTTTRPVEWRWKKNPEFGKLISHLLGWRNTSEHIFTAMAETLSDTDFNFLITKSPKLFTEEENPEKLNILESAHLWRKADSLTQKWYGIASGLPVEPLAAALEVTGLTLDSILQTIPHLPEWRGRPRRHNPPGISGEVYYYDKRHGIVILGKGENKVTRFYPLIIDLGGNDNYHLPENSPLKSSWIVDFSGDDLYSGEDFSIAGGFFGTSVILDLSGNDIYTGRDFSVGCGLYGLGWIEDMNGDDSYRCRTMGVAAGFIGFGLVRDRRGHDTYTCSLYGEGFGGVGAVGLLLDGEGTDVYSTISSFTDVTRYEDHILTLSQGFAYGLRPYASGGIGFLIDSGGNDLYYSDIYGQGSSYWYGLGALIDRSGNDYYLAHQYVQGSGIHLSLGYLRDDSGYDRYIGKGLAQGVGHDYGIGIFHDLAGNDDYVAYDLSQGAGSANGIGLFIDESGDDAYISRVDWHTQGYGNPRRNYGSVGIFLDLRGHDLYTGRGSDRSAWWLNRSKKSNYWGMGIDFE